MIGNDDSASSGAPPAGLRPDAHLRAALRNAPDADATPPRDLSAAILRQARAAVAPRVRLPFWRRWLDPVLARPVMPWAGGLAGVLLASAVGVLWLPERELAEPDATLASAPLARSEVEAPRAVETAVSASPTDTPGPAPAAAPPEPKAARSAAIAAPPKAAAKVAPDAAQQGAADRRRRAEAPPTVRPSQPAARSEEKLELALPAEPAAEPADSATPALPSAPAPKAPAPAATATPGALARRPAQSAAASADNASRQSVLREQASPSQPAGAATLLRLDPGSASAWRWQPHADSAPRAFDAAARAWLARLLGETAARWQPQPAIDAAGMPLAGRVVRWLEGDQPRATAVIDASGVHWRDEPGGPSWFAPLAPEQLARIGAP